MKRLAGTGVALLVALTGGCRCESSGGDGGTDGASATDGGGGGGDAGPDASGDAGGGGTDATLPPGLACTPLPPATGTIVMVTPAEADALPGIVAAAATGTTILLADGTYQMTTAGESARRIQFNTPGVTMRSASGDRDAVVIDGEYLTNEIVTISASDVTIAEMTIMRAVDHPIHVSGSPAGVNGVRLHGLRIVDGGEQFVKINSDGMGNYADDGFVSCSIFEMTAAGRAMVEPNPGGCYTGGVDAHGAWGWVVNDNVFRDIYCDNGSLAEHAVHFWTGSRDTIVERNLIINCARGVGFGLVETGAGRIYSPDPYPGVGYVGHYDGLIRNNVIFADIPYFDTGIELAQARGGRVHHNTIVHSASAFSSIDYRFANTLVEIRDNIVVNITLRDGASGTVEYNLETTSTALYVDAAGYDFHLAAGATEAIDMGIAVTAAGTDIDGEDHTNGAPDLGADERW